LVVLIESFVMVENIASSVTEIQSSVKPNNNWRDLGVHTYIKTALIGALFYFLFHNEIDSIVRRWVTDSSWSHGFLIPVFSLYFINQHKSEILNLKTRPNYLGLIFLICGILFYLLNIVHFQYGYFKPLGMIATLGAIVLFLGGWRLVKYTWLPVSFLVFAVPLPRRYYVEFTIPMRKIAAQVATILLNLINEMEAVANGVVINVIYKGKPLNPPLDVAEACSGMRLLMAFLALGVAMAYLHYRPAWQRIILLVSTVPIAILCNVIRVTVTGFIYVMGDPKYAQGIYHDLLGMAMLPLAFMFYGIIAWFMSSLFVEEVTADTTKNDIIIRKADH